VVSRKAKRAKNGQHYCQYLSGLCKEIGESVEFFGQDNVEHSFVEARKQPVEGHESNDSELVDTGGFEEVQEVIVVLDGFYVGLLHP